VGVVIEHLAAKYPKGSIDVVVGVESRGFIFAGCSRTSLARLVPVRKKGNSPRR